VCTRFVPRLLTSDQKHQRAASSVEFVEMTDDDRNVFKRTVWNLVFRLRSRNTSSECNFAESKETESSETENVKIAGGNNADRIFLY
jgi:hypothetical protein